MGAMEKHDAIQSLNLKSLSGSLNDLSATMKMMMIFHNHNKQWARQQHSLFNLLHSTNCSSTFNPTHKFTIHNSKRSLKRRVEVRQARIISLLLWKRLRTWRKIHQNHLRSSTWASNRFRKRFCEKSSMRQQKCFLIWLRYLQKAKETSLKLSSVVFQWFFELRNTLHGSWAAQWSSSMPSSLSQLTQNLEFEKLHNMYSNSSQCAFRKLLLNSAEERKQGSWTNFQNCSSSGVKSCEILRWQV